ncbi:hypothetical protein VTK56DRAFT_4474 [Thermocarpiscus australiensis]
MPDDEPSNNPFVRFKQHVDANIHAGLNTVMDFTTTTTSRHPAPESNTSPSTSSFNNNNNNDNNDTNNTTTALTLLDEPSLHLEHRLDQLRGGTRDEARLAWRLFLTRSAYSPLRLARELGWQPTPRGLPASAPQQQFGWLDAFEDLMLASSAAPMTDLREKSEAWMMQSSSPWSLVHGPGWGWFGFGSGFGFHGGFWGDGGGGPAAELAWLGRMSMRGLTEVYFPVYDPGLGYQSPRTLEEWAERRRAEQRRLDDAERLWGELEGKRRGAIEEAKSERDVWGDAGDRGSFFSDIGGIVKVLGKVLEDEVRPFSGFGRGEGSGKRDRSDGTTVEKKNAETEDDLYSAIQSAFHESERSLSNFFKSLSEGWRDNSLREPKPASPPKTETAEVVENGITKKTTKKEFVDEHGNAHSKTETTWKDENGRVIMRQVQSSMGRSEHWQRTIDGGSAKPEPDKEATDSSKEQKKEGGWFWR